MPFSVPERARAESKHATAALRADAAVPGARAGTARLAGGLHPSQIPVPGEAAGMAGSSLSGGRKVPSARQLRPSGAWTSVLPFPSRPSAVPAQPVRDVLRGPGQPPAAPVKEEIEAGLHAGNERGLPGGLKSAIESLSGLDLSNVRVHTNSVNPAQVNALAYTQGTHIHLAPGHETHLAHEAWHAVQQARGRVQPAMRPQDGMRVTHDAGLERDADLMGARALARAAQMPALPNQRPEETSKRPAADVGESRRAHLRVSATTDTADTDYRHGTSPPTQAFLTVNGAKSAELRKKAGKKTAAAWSL